MLSQAIHSLRRAAIIAYPTEAVYGLGCDPLSEEAVAQLLALKRRAATQGFILIASHMAQILPYIASIPADAMQTVAATWPGPVTWVFPASALVPAWVRGEDATIALRVTAHPIASALCAAFGRPIISTSANLHGQPPARHALEVAALFPRRIDYIVAGEVGDLVKPTPIRQAISGEVIR